MPSVKGRTRTERPVVSGHKAPAHYRLLGRRRAWLTLRASVPVDGRSITVYEEVHALGQYNKPGTHRHFLQALHRVVPPSCHPVVVTDAGFRGPWAMSFCPISGVMNVGCTWFAPIGVAQGGLANALTGARTSTCIETGIVRRGSSPHRYLIGAAPAKC